MNRKIILILVIIFAVLFILAPFSFSGTAKSGKASLSVSKSADVDRKALCAKLENKYGVAVIIGSQNYNSIDNTPYYTADAVGSWLVDIPLSERTIKVLPYEIVSK